jgi:hypothetical protein
MAGYRRPVQETNRNTVEPLDRNILQEQNILKKKEAHLRSHAMRMCVWCKKNPHNVTCPLAALRPTPEL